MLDKDFKPAIKELNVFINKVNNSNNSNLLIISIERNNGLIYQKKINVFKDGYNDEYNFFIIERLIKTMLWVVGGYKIYIAGSHAIFNFIKSCYSKDGLRKFDYEFMSNVYEHEFEIIECNYDNIPEEKSTSISIGGNLNGKRIGFDAGGSDIKISALINKENIYSEEIIWFPKLNSDPNYHIEEIYNAMKKGIDKLGGDVDAIGVSSAGIYIDNKAMIASLFIKINKDDFNNKIKTIYIDIVKRLEKELNHPIALEVCNDGDVTALAGALDLKDNSVLGIAMGTSEAVGYVEKNGNILGWLNELAFAPIDFNKNSMIDEWSLDYGVGCKYLSQDAVIKLANVAGLEIDSNLSLAEKLKYVQKLNEEGNEIANEIFETIGYYLANAIAYYSYFYDIKHVMVLGRVTSGKGGDTILKICKEVLEKEFPYLSYINLCMPSEYIRRVGQSIAAASLPKN